MFSQPRRSCPGETKVITSQVTIRLTLYVMRHFMLEDAWGKEN